MGAKPKGLVSRREVRARLPEAYHRAANWVATALNGCDDADQPAFCAALLEVVDFLDRKADQAMALTVRRARPEDAFLRDALTLLSLTLGREYVVAHFPNEGKRNAIATAGLLRAGVADICISGAAFSAWIELKVGRNKLTTEQEVFRDDCRKRRIPWALCRTLGEVEDAIVAWGLVERRGRALRLVPAPGLRSVDRETGAAGR